MSTRAPRPGQTLPFNPLEERPFLEVARPDRGKTAAYPGDSAHIAGGVSEVDELLTPRGRLGTPAQRFWHEIASSAHTNSRGSFPGTHEPDLTGLSMHFEGESRTLVVASQFDELKPVEKKEVSMPRRRGWLDYKAKFATVNEARRMLKIEEYDNGGNLIETYPLSEDEFVQYALGTDDYEHTGVPHERASSIWWSEREKPVEVGRGVNVPLPTDHEDSVFNRILDTQEQESLVNLVGLTWQVGNTMYTVHRDDIIKMPASNLKYPSKPTRGLILNLSNVDPLTGALDRTVEQAVTMDELKAHFDEQQSLLWRAGNPANPQADYEAGLNGLQVRFENVPNPYEREELPPAAQHIENQRLQQEAQDALQHIPGVAAPDRLAIYLLTDIRERDTKRTPAQSLALLEDRVAALNPETFLAVVKPRYVAEIARLRNPIINKPAEADALQEELDLREFEIQNHNEGPDKVEALNKLIAEHGPAEVDALISELSEDLDVSIRLLDLPPRDEAKRRAWAADALADHRHYTDNPLEARRHWPTLALPSLASGGIFGNTPEARHARRALVDRMLGYQILKPDVGFERREKIVDQKFDETTEQLKNIIKVDYSQSYFMKHISQGFVKAPLEALMKKALENPEAPDESLSNSEIERLGRLLRRSVVQD
jgi:hypothetical protein